MKNEKNTSLAAPGALAARATFSHRQSARIKKLIWQKLTGAPNNLGLDTFPNPVGHFGAPGGHFGYSGRGGVKGGAALQSVAVRRSTGNDVVATISAVIFFFFFSPPFFLRRDLFS